MRNLGFLVSAWLIGLGCSVPSRPNVGGESHWLAECRDDDVCGEGLRCVCGTCTRACSSDSACEGGRDAACYDANSPLILRRCEDRLKPSHGVCLPRCSQASECGSTRTCIEDACVPLASTDAGSSASSGTQIGDFDAVSDDVSWSTPVQVPPPQTVIAGGDDSILGTWRQSHCDPATVGSYDQQQRPVGQNPCVRLVIERNGAGDITGSVNFDNTMDTRGPFPPVTDPDVGYPPNVEPSQYFDLTWNPVGGVPYRMYDATLRDSHLVFQWSSLEPWDDWCRLQTPYQWHLGDHQRDFCVPQDDAARAQIDPGKFLLCTDGDFIDQCTPPDGANYPGVCAADFKDRAAFCHCDDRSCSADLYHNDFQDFVIDGARMNGYWEQFGGLTAMTFERVEP